MKLQSELSLQLSESQLTGLAVIILDEHGAGLNRDQFNDVAMTMLDDIAGGELLPARTRTKYLAVMWSSYQHTKPVSQLH